jgi:hypothetical protein
MPTHSYLVCYSRNLRVAKSLGMDTIRRFYLLPFLLLTPCLTDVPIGGTFEAVKALEAKLSIDLTGPQAENLSKL